MRRILRWEVAGTALVGTYHEPAGAAPGSGGAAPGEVAVLFTNFGQQPRTWAGDLGVTVADELAAAGYPVFRFDLPGLGDSAGDVPVSVQHLWRMLQEGGHVPATRALVDELGRRYGYRRVVLGGFCGGTATAVRAVEPKEMAIAGLILLEPEFELTPVPEDGVTGPVMSTEEYLDGVRSVKGRLTSPRAWGRFLLGRSDYRYPLRVLRCQGLRWWQRLTRQQMPPGANAAMVRKWRQLMAARLPVLVLTAGTAKRRQYDAAYAADTRRPGRPWLTWHEVAGTNHTLVTGGVRDRVAGHVRDWMRAQFPPVAAPARADSAPATADRATGVPTSVPAAPMA